MMGDIDALVPKRGDESADKAIGKLENSLIGTKLVQTETVPL